MLLWSLSKQGSLTGCFSSKLDWYSFMGGAGILLVGAVWRYLPRILHPVRLNLIAGCFPNALLKLLNP